MGSKSELRSRCKVCGKRLHRAKPLATAVCSKCEKENKKKASEKPDSERQEAIQRTLEANKYDQQLRAMLKEDESRWHEIGKICYYVETKKLYKELMAPEGKPFHSFESWLKDCAPGDSSRARVFVCKRIFQTIQDIPEEERKQIGRENAAVLAKVSKETRSDPVVRKAAKTQSESKLRQTIKDSHPEEHMEVKSRMNLKPEESQKKVIEKALTVAGWLHETSIREEQLEIIAGEWLQSQCQKQQYSELSNEEAYEKWCHSAAAD